MLELGLGLVSGNSLVGVCRHLAAVVSVIYTTVVSIVDLWSIHDGRVRNINPQISCNIWVTFRYTSPKSNYV